MTGPATEAPPGVTALSCDVAVIGGGAAGVAAAVGAAGAGATVVLLESAPYLGGAATLRTVCTYCGLWSCTDEPIRVVTGVADRVLDGLRAIGGVSEPVSGPAHAGLPGLRVVATDAESLKAVLDDLTRAAGVTVLLSTTLSGVTSTGTGFAVEALAFGDSAVHVTAATVVDASGDATAAFLVGADTIRAEDGVRQTSTMSARYGGIPSTADVSAATLQSALSAAKQRGGSGLTSTTGFSIRVPVSDDLVAYLADEDGDPLVPEEYTRATVDARRQARAVLEVIRTLPGCERAYLAGTGPELGVRESRHLRSVAQPTDDDLLRGTVTDEAVALCGWPSEYHPGAGEPSQWRAVGGRGAFGVTLDHLRSATHPRLFGAGRVLTGEHLAGTAIRVMGAAFATGHAAGVAAALVAAGTADDALTERTRHELARQGATLAI